jgi:tyrosine-protein phosphatase YwqE
VGLGGSKVVRLIKQMARENLIDFIGSDGHRPEELRQVLSGWRRQTEKLLGPEACERVLKENPACLLRNEPIELEK